MTAKSNRFIRVVSLVLFSSLIAGVTIVGGSREVVAEESNEIAQIRDSLSDLRTCLSKQGSVLDVYFLIDNSRSMLQFAGGPGTDVGGLRFQAVERSLRPLTDLAEKGTQVNVAGGLFSKDGATVIDWTGLDSRSNATIDSFAETLGETEAGGGTNWPAGVVESQRQLEMQRAGQDNHCQAMVWVTDGGIDIERDPEKTTQGIIDLCGVAPTNFTAEPATSGLMYDLRSRGVVVIGVLLEVPSSIGDEQSDGTRQERLSKTSYFKPVVEGSGLVDASYFNDGEPLSGEFTCGKVIPDARGAMFTIAKADELQKQFEQLVTCIADSCVFVPTIKCVGGVCEIPIPKGIAAMQIDVPSGFNQSDVLRPNGSGACLTGDCTSKEEMEERGTLLIPVQNLAGLWKIRIAVDSLQPLLFDGLKIDIDPIEVNPLEPQIDTEVRLTQKFDAKFDVTNYEAPLDLDARVEFPNGETEQATVVANGDTWRLTWAPKPGERDGLSPNELVVSLNATAADAGPGIPELRLPQIVQRFKVTKKNLDGYPSLEIPDPDSTAYFTAIEGLAGVGSTTLVFKGPSSNNGLVCWSPDSDDGFLGKYESTPKTGLGNVLSASVVASGRETVTCPNGGQGVVIGQGQELAVDIELTASEQAEALISGAMRFDLFGPENERPLPQAIPFEVKTTVVKNNIARFIALGVLLLLGIGVPYLALLFFVRRQASFSPALDGSRWASLRATIGSEGLLSLEEVDPTKYDFLFLNKGELSRAISTGTETHQVIPPRVWPFTPIKTVVKGASDASLFTNHDPAVVAGQSEGISSQVLSNVFYFVADPVQRDSSTFETQTDDWGNETRVEASRTGDLEAGAPRNGRLVVIAPGDGNIAESISKTIARARTWSAWSDIYLALATGGAVEGLASVRVAKDSKRSSSAAPESASPSVENDYFFGEQSAEQTAPEEKKRRFGRSDRSSQGRNEKPESGSVFDDNDW